MTSSLIVYLWLLEFDEIEKPLSLNISKKLVPELLIIKAAEPKHISAIAARAKQNRFIKSSP